MFKVNDRFGLVEVIGIERGMLHLVCSCGFCFKRGIQQAKLKGVRTQCIHCVKNQVGIPTPALNTARPYTEAELRMIKDFENKALAC